MLESIPPGFRFHPTDEELVSHYLTNYIVGVKDEVCVIPIVDDLFQRDPSELPHVFRGSSIVKSKNPEWWFLSTLRYKCLKSGKFHRSTSTGSWKITGRPKEIYDRESKNQIAEMRNLVFCENPRSDKTNWVIHEYYLSGVYLEQREYVLCHLVNRQYDYVEKSARMEVDPHPVERPHDFSEDIIQAKMRSLMEGPSSSATPNYIGNDKMEEVKSTSGGDEDDDMQDLLNDIVFSSDEEWLHSSEFEVELEETSRASSKHAVLKENRRARPSETLEGYVLVDETSGFVEAGDALSLSDSPKSPLTKYPRGNGARPNPAASLHKHSVCHARRIEVQSAANEPSKRSQASRPRDGNERIPVTSSHADNGCRPPFDYLVNLGVGILLLVLMMLWLLLH